MNFIISDWVNKIRGTQEGFAYYNILIGQKRVKSDERFGDPAWIQVTGEILVYSFHKSNDSIWNLFDLQSPVFRMHYISFLQIIVQKISFIFMQKNSTEGEYTTNKSPKCHPYFVLKKTSTGGEFRRGVKRVVRARKLEV